MGWLRRDRETIAERERLEKEEQRKEADKQRQLELRKADTHNLVIDQLRVRVRFGYLKHPGGHQTMHCKACALLSLVSVGDWQRVAKSRTGRLSACECSPCDLRKLGERGRVQHKSEAHFVGSLASSMRMHLPGLLLNAALAGGWCRCCLLQCFAAPCSVMGVVVMEALMPMRQEEMAALHCSAEAEEG